ncbi:MAG: DUF6132 family protein [Ferruginibacter sp.]|nr:hypothetical protein [Bacteroidota bacterium]MBX2920477.1 hypothetical protein [Ferruginibacter sp.]MCB0710365.1 hypothetical protein [Chitinophagaceae bacterium]MCC7378349.1 hypothetical protein [Chitinophagaceae bacterium]
MKRWVNKNKLYLIGALVGAVGGFIYWQQIGCVSGTCMITSKPVNSTLYGALMGTLLLGLFKKEDAKDNIKKEDAKDV